MNNTFKVKIFESQGTKTLAVGKASFCIGRAKGCDVVLDDPSIHSEHVRVWCEGGRLWIQDLGSPNGTSINDMKLPPLKPMLCREIDTLKLGESPFTIGIEPVFVRAPQVKAAEAAKPAKVPDIDPETANARRVELAGVSRELAELRLQLQMARLEKEAIDEIKKYRESLQEQIKGLEVQKNHMIHEMAEWDKDKVIFRQNLDQELANLKSKTIRELKETEERETKRFKDWKSGCVDEMNELVLMLMSRRFKPLLGKTLGAADIKQFDRDLTQIMRKVLLNELADDETVVKEIADQKSQAKVPAAKPYPKHMAIGMVGVVAVFGIVLASWQLYAKKNMSRNIASQQPAVRLAYKPPTTSEFKKSYTDNVLFTTRFAELEQSVPYHSRWITELNKIAVSEWQLAESALSPLAAKEMALIQDLMKLKSAIQGEQDTDTIVKMRAREAQFQTELKNALKSKDLVDRFNRLKRSFYAKNQNLSVASAKEAK